LAEPCPKAKIELETVHKTNSKLKHLQKIWLFVANLFYPHLLGYWESFKNLVKNQWKIKNLIFPSK